ncbi:nucleotide sugar dehydrogenase [Xylaria sp. CBS 124048]|nr:nucleotide sugar dehydrogenase [Xylaria sp. CBS 124048]
MDSAAPAVTASSNRLSSGSSSSRIIRNICYVGAGYVGGPTAAVTAYQNPDVRVTVVDSDKTRIRRWNSKHLPIYEPGLRDIVRIARDGSPAFVVIHEFDEFGRLHINTHHTSIPFDAARRAGWRNAHHKVPARQPNLFFSVERADCIREADAIFIAVGTPTKSSGEGAGAATDLSAFKATVAEIASVARPGTIIIEKSTVPCQTAQLVQRIMALHRPDVHFEILSNPEFLAAGTAVKDLICPERVLIGCSHTISGHGAAEALASLYNNWIPRSRIITTNTWSSELSKLVANAMLAQRISSINSVSAICEKTGADVAEVATSIGSDPRIGSKFLKAGIGFGGSCFKKDILSLAYIAESLGLDEVGEYWRQVIKLNDYQCNRFSKRVLRCLDNKLVGKKLTILGFAFKANTSDTRESLSLGILATLLREKPAMIAIFDPSCNPTEIWRVIRTLIPRQYLSQIVACSNVYDACKYSNAVIIANDHAEFRNSKSRADSSPAKKSNGKLDLGLFSQHETIEFDGVSFPISTWFREPLRSGCRAGNHFQHYRDEPPCVEGCPECALVNRKGYQGVGKGIPRAGEPVDWQRICDQMKKPKWLFDGKGVIDPKEMASLDIHVESIGRQGQFLSYATHSSSEQ